MNEFIRRQFHVRNFNIKNSIDGFVKGRAQYLQRKDCPRCVVSLGALIFLLKRNELMLSTSILNPSSVDVTNPVTNAARTREVRVQLRRSGYAEMRRVEVSFEENVLTLSGTVHSFHMKQMAQEIARQVVPYVVIENRLTVVSTASRAPK